MSDPIWLQLYSCEPKKSKKQEQAVTLWKTCSSTTERSSSSGFRFKLMSVKQDEHSARERLGGLLNLPRVSKGYVNRYRCPSCRSRPGSSQSQSTLRFLVPVSCCWCCFSPVGWVLHSLSISWASHIRRTSGVRHQEWSLWGATPPPPPNPSLFVSLYLPVPSLFPGSPSGLLSSLHPLHIPHSVLCLPVLLLKLHQQIPRLPANFEPVRSPLFGGGYATSVGALSARVGRPRPTDIPQHASQQVCN